MSSSLRLTLKGPLADAQSMPPTTPSNLTTLDKLAEPSPSSTIATPRATEIGESLALASLANDRASLRAEGKPEQYDNDSSLPTGTHAGVAYRSKPKINVVGGCSLRDPSSRKRRLTYESAQSSPSSIFTTGVKENPASVTSSPVSCSSLTLHLHCGTNPKVPSPISTLKTGQKSIVASFLSKSTVVAETTSSSTNTTSLPNENMLTLKDNFRLAKEKASASLPGEVKLVLPGKSNDVKFISPNKDANVSKPSHLLTQNESIRQVSAENASASLTGEANLLVTVNSNNVTSKYQGNEVNRCHSSSTVALEEISRLETVAEKASAPLKGGFNLLVSTNSNHVTPISQTKRMNGSKTSSNHQPCHKIPSPPAYGSILLNAKHKLATMAMAAPGLSYPTPAIVTPKTKAIAGFKPLPTKNSTLSQKSPSTQKGVVRTVSKSMLYVGIILERPESLKSWGLVFTKQRANQVVILRVIGGEKRPTVKWCRVTNAVPNSSVIYRTATTSTMTLDKYEPFITHNFPQTCDESRLQGTGLLERFLNPGDAIISINGFPISSFPTIGQFASYIRSNCGRKMTIVAQRHEHVWGAALEQMLDLERASVDNQTVTDRVSKAVREAWVKVFIPSGGNHHQVKRTVTPHPVPLKRPKVFYTNSKFQDKDGKPIYYCDNDDCDVYDPDDGKRIRNFVNDEIEKSFDEWLRKRKAAWRESRPRKNLSHTKEEVVIDEEHKEESSVQHEFWLENGHESFDQWLVASKTKWTRSYSWHKKKRKALQSECEREVHFPTDENHSMLDDFESWLTVRKQQWRLKRRKRQRERADEYGVSVEDEKACLTVPMPSEVCSTNNDSNPSTTNSNQYWDEILEDQERLTKEEVIPCQPMDISWVFDSQLGAPDDIIVNVMTYLLPSDHGNLLCLSYTTNVLFIQRSVMWRSLCPKHWVLPRRPRKSWCAVYITKIRAEEEASRKQSDDLLVKANVIIEKGDQLTKLERLIRKAVKDFQFSVNYISCVVLERNSLLNLAVIDKRHKITKWLIEEKNADIEACDRGNFTPLLNAAWNGDKYIVRYLLGRGCDRTQVGYNHCSQGLAPATFQGLNAEGWARKRGHDEVAELIRFGL